MFIGFFSQGTILAYSHLVIQHVWGAISMKFKDISYFITLIISFMCNRNHNI